MLLELQCCETSPKECTQNSGNNIITVPIFGSPGAWAIGIKYISV